MSWEVNDELKADLDRNRENLFQHHISTIKAQVTGETRSGPPSVEEALENAIKTVLNNRSVFEENEKDVDSQVEKIELVQDGANGDMVVGTITRTGGLRYYVKIVVDNLEYENK